MSETRASAFNVLGTKGPWSLLGLRPISPIPSGEEKIDGCLWGINMFFFFFFLLDSGRPSFSLPHYSPIITQPLPALS